MKTAELNRLIHNLCRVGVIAELDHAAHKVRVKTGENLTAWLPWPADIGRNFIRWRPLRLNTQVILLSPGGDISQGIIAGMLYSNEMPAPANDENLDVVEFTDGTKITYNSSETLLKIECAGGVVVEGANISVNASGTAIIDVTGDATISTDGNATVTAGGNVEVDGASITLNGGAAGGVVCQNHVCAFTGGPHPQASITVTAGD